MATILSMNGMTKSARVEKGGVFSGHQIYARLEDKSAMTLSLFLRHLKVLSSDQLSCLTVVNRGIEDMMNR